MRDGGGLEFYGGDIVVALVCGEEPGLFQQWDWAAEGRAEIVFVEVWIRILALERGGREVGLAVEVVESPGGKRGVLVVIKDRAVIFGAAALGVNANVGDACVLGAEVGGEDVYIADGFERRLALRGFAEDAAVRTLAVEGKAGAVALGAQEFEFAGGGTLRDVGIEIEEGIDVAAVAWEFGDGSAADCLGDGLIFCIDGDGFGRNRDSLFAFRDF